MLLEARLLRRPQRISNLVHAVCPEFEFPVKKKLQVYSTNEKRWSCLAIRAKARPACYEVELQNTILMILQSVTTDLRLDEFPSNGAEAGLITATQKKL